MEIVEVTKIDRVVVEVKDGYKYKMQYAVCKKCFNNDIRMENGKRICHLCKEEYK